MKEQPIKHPPMPIDKLEDLAFKLDRLAQEWANNYHNSKEPYDEGKCDAFDKASTMLGDLIDEHLGVKK